MLMAHGVLAKVLADEGDPAAEAEAHQAVELAESTDMLWLQGEAWAQLAEALFAQGRLKEATTACDTALDRFERKGATALANRIRARRQHLTAEAEAGQRTR